MQIRVTGGSGILAFVLILLFIGGWIANVVKLIGMFGGPLGAEFIGRAIGIFAAPLGAILGYF